MNPPELRTIIIDDEAPAREALINLLSDHPNITVIGEAGSAAEAIVACRDLRPNLIFLDVQLGDGDGFEVLSHLSPTPATIFVTAWDNYAFRAFEVNAIDYLLKPTSPARLAVALDKIIQKPPDPQVGPFRDDDRMFLRVGDGVVVVTVSKICGIEAQENYSLVHFANEAPKLIRRSMTEWENILPRRHFFRPSRSLILNLRAIQGITTISRDETEIQISGFATPVRLGRKPAIQLRRAMTEPPLL
jgi:two-component system LytT family response regulator